MRVLQPRLCPPAAPIRGIFVIAAVVPCGGVSSVSASSADAGDGVLVAANRAADSHTASTATAAGTPLAASAAAAALDEAGSNGSNQPSAAACLEHRAELTALIRKHNLKAFPQVVSAPAGSRLGYHSLMLTCGLGALTPNTVVTSFYEGRGASKSGYLPVRDAADWAGLVLDALQLRKNVLILRDLSTLQPELVSKESLRNVAARMATSRNDPQWQTSSTSSSSSPSFTSALSPRSRASYQQGGPEGEPESGRGGGGTSKRYLDVWISMTGPSGVPDAARDGHDALTAEGIVTPNTAGKARAAGSEKSGGDSSSSSSSNSSHSSSGSSGGGGDVGSSGGGGSDAIANEKDSFLSTIFDSDDGADSESDDDEVEVEYDGDGVPSAVSRIRGVPRLLSPKTRRKEAGGVSIDGTNRGGWEKDKQRQQRQRYDHHHPRQQRQRYDHHHPQQQLQHGALTVRLLLQFGHILRCNRDWKRHTKLRALHVVSATTDVWRAKQELEKALKAARIDAEAVIVPLHLPRATAALAAKKSREPSKKATRWQKTKEDQAREEERELGFEELEEYCLAMNAEMMRWSRSTSFAFTQLPWMHAAGKDAPRWVDALRSLTKGLPPTGLATAGEVDTTFFSESL